MNNSIKNTLRSGLLLLPLLTGLQASSCGICKFYAENNLSCDDWYCVGFEYYYADHTSTQPWGSGWTWVRRVFGSSYDTMHHEGFISGLYVWTDWSHIPFPLPPNSSMLGFPYLNFGDDEGDLSGKLTRDPVNVESGCVVDECSDITLTHPALPLKWTRFYNGAWATNATDIGKGWRHSYDWRLLFFSVERCQIITPDGVTYQFAPTLEENTWETVYDVKWTLIKEYDGSTDEFVLSISPVKKLRFSANGNLLSYDNGQGGHLEFSYSASGILEHIVFSCNHQLTIEHSAGRITAVRTPISSHWVEYDYDECGNLRAASIHYSGKTRTTYYEYGPIGLISMTSANGETAAYTYATTPGLVEYTKCTNSVFGAGWYEHSLEYCTNRICITAQWEGDDITGDYVPYTNIVKQSHTHVRYQASQDSTIEEDIAYSQGIVTDKWFGTNLLFHTEYLTDGKWPQRSRKETTWRTTEIGLAEPMAIRTWTYDDNYHPISESYSFCANGGLAGQSTISWFWDETLGVCTARIDQAGWNLTTEFSTNGLPTRSFVHTTSGNMLETFYSYTNEWMLAEGTSSRGGTTKWRRNEDGNPIEVIQPSGQTYTFTWITPGRLANVTRSGSAPFSTSYTTDDEGRILHISFSDNTSEELAYDKLGRLTNSIDRSGINMSYAYAVGNHISQSHIHYTEGDTNAVATRTFFYDKLANLTGISGWDGRIVETFILDEQERIKAIVNDEGQMATLKYDFDKYLNYMERYDNTHVTIKYDRVGNISTITYPDEMISFSSLPNGMPTLIQCGNKWISYTYDEAGRITSSSNNWNGVKYSYTSNITTTESPIGIEVRSYDGSGRLTSICDEADNEFSFSYNVNNALVSSIGHSSGFSTILDYDSSDRISSVCWLHGSNMIERFVYAYTNFNQVSSITSLNNGRIEYVYDGLRRLTGERYISTSDALERGNRYAYALSGNRLWKAAGTGGNAGVKYIFSSGNKLERWTTVGPAIAFEGLTAVTNGYYLYNAAGCLTNITMNTANGDTRTIDFQWNGRYLLTQVRIDANGIFSYDYDPDGRLLFRTDAGNTYGRIYDGLHMKYEYNATTGEPTRSFTHSDAIDNWLGYSAYANGTTNHYVFITDVFGTVIAVVDSNGNIAERYAYDAYGRVVAVYDSEGNIHQRTQIGNSLLWRGGEYDWNTGLYLFRSRWYDPVTGRWISKDPIGSAGGHNLYEYCGNDPVNCIDPFGTEAIVLSGRSSLGTIRGYLQKSPGRSTMNQMNMYLQPEAYLIAEYAYGINGGFKFHSGMGEMDFATQNGINDWHVPRRGVMSPSAFGNYAAGYYAGYSQLPGMYLGVRAGGLAYSVTAAATAAAINAVNALGIPSALGWPKVPSGNPERWDDSQSVPDIDNGFADGKRDREMGK